MRTRSRLLWVGTLFFTLALLSEQDGFALDQPQSEPKPEERLPSLKLTPAKGIGFGAPPGAMIYNIGFGYAWMPYPSTVKNQIKPEGSKSTPVVVDLAVLRTFYGHDNALGVSANYAVEFSSSSSVNIFDITGASARTKAQRLFTGLSFRQALGTHLLEGVNLRVDAGYGRYLLSSDLTPTSGDPVHLNLKNGGGPGLLLGLSYAFRLRPESWLSTKSKDNYYMELLYQLSYVRMDPPVPGVNSLGLSFGF
ncbi:hypothetical protein EBZ37_04345 [bacterium]|nr:hypothetical protein [bacterium]